MDRFIVLICTDTPNQPLSSDQIATDRRGRRLNLRRLICRLHYGRILAAIQVISLGNADAIVIPQPEFCIAPTPIALKNRIPCIQIHHANPMILRKLGTVVPTLRHSELVAVSNNAIRLRRRGCRVRSRGSGRQWRRRGRPAGRTIARRADAVGITGPEARRTVLRYGGVPLEKLRVGNEVSAFDGGARVTS